MSRWILTVGLNKKDASSVFFIQKIQRINESHQTRYVVEQGV